MEDQCSIEIVWPPIVTIRAKTSLVMLCYSLVVRLITKRPWRTVMLTRWNVRQLGALFVLFMMTLNPSTAFALDDGEYKAVYKVTWVHKWNNTEGLGHEGTAVFHIKDNALLDVEIEDFSGGELNFHIEIDNDTGVIGGYLIEKGRPDRSKDGRGQSYGASMDLKWNINGAFIDNVFAGEVTTYMTHFHHKGRTEVQPEPFKWATYVFESP